MSALERLNESLDSLEITIDSVGLRLEDIKQYDTGVESAIVRTKELNDKVLMLLGLDLEDEELEEEIDVITDSSEIAQESE